MMMNPMHYGYIPIKKMHQGILAKCSLLLPFSSSIIISDNIWRKSRFHFLSLLVLPQISFVKYSQTTKILMQIFEYFRSHFHNEGGDCEKSYFEVFSGSGPICRSRKFQPSQTPPSHFLPISPRFLTNIRCRYFSLNIWVVYDQLELD